MKIPETHLARCSSPNELSNSEDGITFYLDQDNSANSRVEQLVSAIQPTEKYIERRNEYWWNIHYPTRGREEDTSHLNLTYAPIPWKFYLACAALGLLIGWIAMLPWT